MNIILNTKDHVTSILVNKICEVLQYIVDMVILPINQIQAVHACDMKDIIAPSIWYAKNIISSSN